MSPTSKSALKNAAYVFACVVAGLIADRLVGGPALSWPVPWTSLASMGAIAPLFWLWLKEESVRQREWRHYVEGRVELDQYLAIHWAAQVRFLVPLLVAAPVLLGHVLPWFMFPLFGLGVLWYVRKGPQRLAY